MKITQYAPKDFRIKAPLVVALPGLVGEDYCRIDGLLEKLKQQGIAGLKINYTNETLKEQGVTCLKSNGTDERLQVRVIECRPNIQETVEIIEGWINQQRGNRSIDITRIALLANSSGVIPATKYLLSSSSLGLRAYVSVSPILGWPHFLTPLARRGLEEGGGDLEISTTQDKANGQKRVVPWNVLSEFMNINLLLDLRGYSKRAMTVGTIIGQKDHLTEPQKMKEYHAQLGGNPEGLFSLEAGHEATGFEKVAIDFLARELKR